MTQKKESIKIYNTHTNTRSQPGPVYSSTVNPMNVKFTIASRVVSAGPKINPNTFTAVTDARYVVRSSVVVFLAMKASSVVNSYTSHQDCTLVFL